MKKIIKFKKGKKIGKKRLAIIITFIILIAGLITTIVLYNQNKEFRNFMDKYIFRKNVTEENVPMIEIDYDSNTNIIPYGKNICILAENALTQYNSSGQIEKEVKIEINNPIYDSKNKYLSIGEKGSHKLYLIEGNHIIWEKNVDGNLDKITVNKNGYVSAIITGTTHKSVIITYDKEGNELFKTYLSDTIAVDAIISPDNTEFAYAEVNNSGTKVQSNIKIISIEEAKETNTEAKYTYTAPPDSLILRMKYDEQKLICMFDDSIQLIENQTNTEIMKINEDDIKSIFVDIELINHIYRTYEKTTGLFSANTVIEIKNVNTQKNITYTIEEVAKSTVSNGTIIAINLGNEIDFIDTNGWLKKRYYSAQVVKDIIICDGLAGIIYRDKIELINL